MVGEIFYKKKRRKEKLEIWLCKDAAPVCVCVCVCVLFVASCAWLTVRERGAVREREIGDGGLQFFTFFNYLPCKTKCLFSNFKCSVLTSAGNVLKVLVTSANV